MKILSFGEIVWDVYGEKSTLGGAPLNLAIHAAMNGADVSLVSAVGDDALGDAAIECAKSYGVGVKYISRIEGVETAKCTVSDDENGLPAYKLADVAAFDRICEPDTDKYTDVIAFGTLALRYENNRRVIDRMLDGIPHGEVFCDINLREPFYSEETVKYCLSKATIIKVSDGELDTVFGYHSANVVERKAAAEQLCGIYKNIRLFLITLGSDGSLCFDVQSGNWYTCGAEKTDVVSTVGAGDSLSVAFLVRLHGGCSVLACLEYAAHIGAMVCACDAAFSKDMMAVLR